MTSTSGGLQTRAALRGTSETQLDAWRQRRRRHTRWTSRPGLLVLPTSGAFLFLVAVLSAVLPAAFPVSFAGALATRVACAVVAALPLPLLLYVRVVEGRPGPLVATTASSAERRSGAIATGVSVATGDAAGGAEPGTMYRLRAPPARPPTKQSSTTAQEMEVGSAGAAIDAAPWHVSATVTFPQVRVGQGGHLLAHFPVAVTSAPSTQAAASMRELSETGLTA